jgi:hypothetical protein
MSLVAVACCSFAERDRMQRRILSTVESEDNVLDRINPEYSRVALGFYSSCRKPDIADEVIGGEFAGR